jgi:hypothetical protein
MSADPRGYYRILRVPPGASQDQIKQAYRALAKALHPDLNRGQDTTAAFQAVNEAYGVLSDPSQRAAYDQTGSAEPGPQARPAGAGARPAPQPVHEVEPYTCVDCGCVSPRLRHIKYTQVVSYLIGSYKTNIWGVFCETCASKRLTKASLITGAFGWMSAPGLLYSAHALGRNLTGGKQENLINLEICARQAVYYLMKGERANARIAATDARAFAGGVNEGWWNDNEKRRARELIPIIEKVLAQV